MTTLTDRYVWAAVRSVPEAQRTELARELRERIGDETDALVEDERSPADAERAALTGLGDPVALAASYVDRPLRLIGPKYYLLWLRLLKLVLAVSLPFTALGVAIAQAVAGSSVGSILGAVVATLISVGVHVCFWITLVFAILDHTPASRRGIDPSWTLDMLPAASEPGMASRRGDLIASLIFLGVFAAAIIWQQFGVIWIGGERQPIPVLDPALWSFWIPYFLGLLVIEAIFAVVVYLRGWNWTLAGLNVLLNIAFTLPALWLFVSGQLIDPAFIETIGWPWGGAGNVTVVVLVVVIIGIAVWDIIDGFIKAARGRGSSALGRY